MSLFNQRKQDNTSRLNFTTSEETLDAIDLLSEEMGISRSATINHLVSIGLAVETLLDEGGDLCIRMADGQIFPVSAEPKIRRLLSW